MFGLHHVRVRKSGGRCSRQPGQIRKEAATTNSRRVVPASTAQAGMMRRRHHTPSVDGGLGPVDDVALPRRNLRLDQS